MKKIIIVLLTLISSSAFALEFDLTTMIGFGYRMDFENTRNYNDSYQEAERKKREDKDTGLFTAKVFMFSAPQSESKVLVGGFGANYQFNNKIDYSFSPVAWRSPTGLTMSLDLYKKSEKGGTFGFGIGWSF